MKRVLLFTLMVLMNIGLVEKARAAILIEPVVGWSFAQKLNVAAGRDYSGGDGMSYGGRLGYQNWGFQFGLDYLKSKVDMSSNDFDRTFDSDQWAAFVGFKFPILFRVYGAYIFAADADTKLNNTTAKFEDGTGGKIGFDCTILPFLDVILEYRRGTYGTTKVGGLTNHKGTTFEALMLGLSFPITI